MSQPFIPEFNRLSHDAARNKLLACCGARWWSEQLATRRPYANMEEFHTVADQVFDQMSHDDWLEAIGSHPRIGDLESLKMKFAGNKQWSSGEQSSVAMAEDDVLRQLKLGNDAYFEKFGYTFVVCATGKSADEMLQILEGRLQNEPDTEIDIAASEQRKITHLRIDKLAANAN